MLATFQDLPVARKERGLSVLTNLVDHSEKVDVTHALSLGHFCTDQSTDACNLLGSACCPHGERIVSAEDPLGSFREMDVTHALWLDHFCTDQSTDACNLLESACCLHGERIVGADKPCGSFREGGRHTSVLSLEFLVPITVPMLATFSDLPVTCMEQGLSVLTTLSDHSEKVDVTHVLSLDQFCTD